MKSKNLFFLFAVSFAIVLVCLNLVSAYDMSFDNVKTFEKSNSQKYGSITIKNAFGLDVPIIGGNLSRYTLNNNTDECLIDCSAEGNATLYTSGSLFTNMNFKDSSGKTKSSIPYKMYIEVTDTYNVEKIESKQDCQEIYVPMNKSTNTVCTTKETGRTNVTKYRTYWKEYLGETLSPGDYNWRITAKKNITDRIDWIATAFGNDLTEFAWWNNAWAYKRKITISNLNIPTNLTNYTTIVFLNSTNFNFSLSQTLGQDIRFTDATETSQLNYEIENFSNPSQNATVWVQIPAVSNSATTDFYMYYNNSGATDGQQVFNTWNNNFAAIWHAQNFTSTFRDSTGNQNNATITGTGGQSILIGDGGIIDKGLNLNFFLSSSNVSTADSDSLNFSGNITISTWFYYRGVANAQANGVLVDKGANTDYSLLATSGDKLNFQFGSTCAATDGNTTLTKNAWHYAVFQYNGTGCALYQDGVSVINVAGSGMPIGTKKTVNIGYRYDAPTIRSINATIDEVRISNVSRGFGWAKADYFGGINQLLTFGTASKNILLTVTTNAPIAGYVSPVSNVLFNGTVTPTGITNSNATLWIWNADGTLNQTNTQTITGTVANYTTWNISLGNANNYLYNIIGCATDDTCTWGTNTTFSVQDNITVNLVALTIGYNSTVSNVFFNSTLNPNTLTHRNATLYVYLSNGTIYLTNTTTTSGQSLVNPTWNISLSDKVNYSYNVYACSTSSVCTTGNSNITFTVDTGAPSISSNAPPSVVNYQKLGTNLTVNWSISDPSLQSCWISYKNVNITVVCSSNTYGINITDYNNNSLVIYANDTFGNLASLSKSWIYTVFENNVTSNSSVIETDYQTNVLNITLNSTLYSSSAVLHLGGVQHSSTKTTSGDNTIFTAMFDTPNVADYTNLTGVWALSYANATSTYYQNFTSFNQSVSDLRISICNSTYVNPFINFTFKDEQSLLNINGSTNLVTFGSYYVGQGSVTNSYLFQNLTSNPSYAYCADPVAAKISTGVNYQYSATGYPQRNFVSSYNLTSTPTNQLLYLLSTADGVYTTMVVYDTNLNIQQNAQITVTRLFAGVPVTIAQGTTGADGAVTFWLNPNVQHTFTITKSGCVSSSLSVTPTQPQYTIQLQCSASTNNTFVSQLQGITWSRTPQSGVIAPGLTVFNYSVYSFSDNLVSVRMDLINVTGSLLATNTSTAGINSGCNATLCSSYITYNILNGDNIKGRYYVTTTQGTVLVEADAFWRAIFTNASSTNTLKQFINDFSSLFGEMGQNSAECSVAADQSSCNAISTCQWQSTMCLPSDEVNKIEYSRIVFMFLLMAIVFALIGRFTGYDFANPGFFILLLWSFITIGSLAGGRSGEGLFYFNTLTKVHFINNYILAIVLTFYAAGYWAMLGRDRR